MNIFEKLAYVKNAENMSHKSPRIIFSNVLAGFQANKSTLKFFSFSEFTFLGKKIAKKGLFFDQNCRNFFFQNIRSRNLKFFFPKFFLETFQHVLEAILSVRDHCFDVFGLILDHL